MHDRRIDGEEFVFGNAGGLFNNAMTLFDHQTRSIWSQPWGRSILGVMRNTQLRLLPAQMVSWGVWKSQHPHSLVLVNDLQNVTREDVEYPPNLVIGIHLGHERSAYYIADIISAGVINAKMKDGQPVVLWAVAGDYRTYLRLVGDLTLTFQQENGAVTDVETGSKWDMQTGLAHAGPLLGQALQQLPSSTSYDWAWRDFYPESEIYSGDH